MSQDIEDTRPTDTWVRVSAISAPFLRLSAPGGDARDVLRPP